LAFLVQLSSLHLASLASAELKFDFEIATMSDAFEERRRKALEEYEARTGKKAGIEIGKGVENLKVKGSLNTTATGNVKKSAPADKPKGEIKRYVAEPEMVAPVHDSAAARAGNAAADAATTANVVDASSRPAKDLAGPGAHHGTASSSSSSAAAHPPSNKNWREEAAQREAAEAARKEAEEERRKERAAGIVKAASPAKGPAPKKDWREVQREKEEAERARKAQEESQRMANAAAVAKAGASEMEQYEAKIAAREAAKRKELEEAEARRKEAVTAYLFCSNCGTKMEVAKSHTQPNGSTFCLDCHAREALKLKGPKCVACKTPIGGKWTVIRNSKYHPDCVNCSKCKKSLGGGQIIIQGPNFFCGDCKPGLLG
jgi:LIM domain